MNRRNAPNLVTILRLALAPLAAWAIAAGRYRLGLAIFIAAGMTDGLDGYLARTLKAKTRLGGYLDPIADKALLSAGYIALGLSDAVPWWLVVLIFGRDLLILVLVAGAMLLTRYREFPPSVAGKVSTMVQIGAAAAIILGEAFPEVRVPAKPLIWTTAAATAASALGYIIRAARMALALRPRAGHTVGQ